MTKHREYRDADSSSSPLDTHSLKRLTGYEQSWSQVNETISLLAIAATQIETSFQEGDDAVDTLTSSFTTIAEQAQFLLSYLDKTSCEIPSTMRDAAEVIHKEVDKAVISFQFYDRLSQRIRHASESLEKTGHLLTDSKRRYVETEWTKLQEDIRTNYTMEAEHIMFRHILAGHTIAEAIEIFHQNMSDPSNNATHCDDDIELF